MTPCVNPPAHILQPSRPLSFGSSQLGVGKVGLYLLELDQLVRSLVDKCVVIYFFYILKYIVVFVQA